MEFRFNVNRLLPRKINKISHTLVPEDFRGNRTEFKECQRLLSRVLDEMGEASAIAQGLSKPITSAYKLRDTDHLVYLLVDSQGNNGLGTVVGLLKTGSKNLFIFDENGLHYQLQPRCILDFYIHESRQRMGLGNVLYQHMLAEEKIKPVKLAIDRPSEKFLQFLRKHYGLDRVIPQNNKFVVFQGFFDDECQDAKSSRYGPGGMVDDDSQGNNNNNHNSGMNNCKSASSNNGAPFSGVSRSAYGRYAAARPPCSMANIIHNSAVLGQTTERTGEMERARATSKLERPRSLSLYSGDDQKQRMSVSGFETPVVPESRSAVPSERMRMDEARSRNASVRIGTTETDGKRATSAAFGPIVNHETTQAFSAMSLEAEPEVEKSVNIVESVKPPQSASHENIKRAQTPFSSTHREDPHSEKTTTSEDIKPLTSSGNKHSTPNSMKTPTSGSSGGVKASPSCAQEVGGNQSTHLDLKFYHSPLW
ncbi:alpha-tubulin N-acetyltransferase-like [Venturia canescens]|uniref:alpha-tubulin N-acetyltransferase-like n=1 Tax=Venturia canescens TaxID=32260 RepID=UPI001C9BD092|nr:alpha-tubulin N-acetyltransferase-like [Venturia canescens]XP_043287042.1 alpha-tubulin N-acetyltransferase-like [Venturia canescens]XP_043287043.1 alpha-tubulin N-acetyltransferase-like [Venturia canescens]